MLFSLLKTVSDRKIRIDFYAPDISPNGWLLLVGNIRGTIGWKIGSLVPDTPRREFIRHTYIKVVDQCVGQMGKLTLPLLRPGRRNQSQVVFLIMRRMVGYLHNRWSRTVIELRGDRNFCNHEFMDRRHDRWYVRYTVGLYSNTLLLSMVNKPRWRAEKNYGKMTERQERDNDAKRAKGRKDISQAHCR